jgi:uncharacterized membrane protein
LNLQREELFKEQRIGEGHTGVINMKTKFSSIILIILCTFLISYAQILYKKGSATLSTDISQLVKNFPIFLGLGLYFIASMMMVFALKSGELSILYPFLALSYVWVSLLSLKFLPLPEHMNLFKWVGIAIIIIGVSFIGIGSKAES